MAEALLTIDLDAVAANYQALKTLGGGAQCGAVVKADAYGCGLGPVARRLAAEGCSHFFVAQVEEGSGLRAILPEAEIYILNGLSPCYLAFKNNNLIPVLNSLEEIKAWTGFSAGQGSLPCAIQFDTGMSRLGLPPDEAEVLFNDEALLSGLDIRLILSHLACADTPDHPMNARQLEKFRDISGRKSSRFSGIPASLAATGGIVLGADYHFDLLRPGVGLYGGLPFSNARPVVGLEARLIQTRVIQPGDTVGYGAQWSPERESRIATVAVGYADGYIRAAGRRAEARITGYLAPLVGRVSMDLLTFDVTDIPASLAHPGAMVELIGPDYTIDDLADAAGTIGYEILTSLGARYERRYLGGPE